ncbi:MAG: adenylate/guanylate cyclase domain-containing protein [Xanthobacteraceae bacterium]
MAAITTRDIADWLMDGARSAARPDQVLGELCEKLLIAGLPLWRVGVFVRTLHPDLFGRSFVWRPGAEVVVGTAEHGITETDTFRTSPLAVLYQTGKIVRHRVVDGEGVEHSPFLREMQAEGVTDYIAFPLIFSDSSVHSATWSTKQAGGFTDEQIDALSMLMPTFTRVAEIRALRRLATNLLDTYVGARAGERIMAGQIRRGSGDALNAVIWLSDMRGFTALSDRVSAQSVVNVLNRYFDCQVPPIAKHGGEVLKFMGDGLLAIFPVSDDEADRSEVYARAVSAAREARSNVAALNKAQGPWSTDRVRFGLALHIGQVLYGNIGGGNRLDFTCIGPAVNLAARIEKIAGKLGRTIVASSEFARHAQEEWEHVGQFSLAGFSAKQTVLGLRDESQALEEAKSA